MCHVIVGYTIGTLDKACTGTYGSHERNTCLFKVENIIKKKLKVAPLLTQNP